VSVVIVISRSISNVGVEEVSSEGDERLQPRIDCNVEENSTLSFSPQYPVLKHPQAAMKINPTSAYEGM